MTTPSDSRSFSRRDENARDNGHQDRPNEGERFAMERVGRAADPDGWEGDRQARSPVLPPDRPSVDRLRGPQGGPEEDVADVSSDPEIRGAFESPWEMYARRRGQAGQIAQSGQRGEEGPGRPPGQARSAGPSRAGRRWYREPLTVTDLMTRDVKTVPRDASVADIATLMRDEDVGVVPVVDESGCLAGIVTDRDIVIRGLAGPNATPPNEQQALDLASRDVDAVSPRDSITSVLELMGRRQIRRAPVIGENRRLVGMISLGDIASRADYDEELQEALQEISARRSFWSRIWR